ncbi:MAG: anti-sigma factor [Sphingomicrobium sp.]
MTDDRSPIEAAAAEYALGLLTGDELRDARQRTASDPAFAAEVARWRGRLAPLHAEAEPVEPPMDVWGRIEARALGLVSANDNVPALRRRVKTWRAATGGMGLLAACLAIVLLFEPRTRIAPPVQSAVPQPSALPMVAMLGYNGSMKVVASWDPTARQLILAVPGNLPVDPNHSHELWVIPSGGKPRSLGTMPSTKQMHMKLADALAQLLQQGATIAISVEPKGGSPTGSPTGPVVASGALVRT